MESNSLIKKRKSPSQRRSEATVDAIMTATAQVLVSDGYSTLTTTRVAERAGVSIGTLYQYYPSKQSLIADLAERTLDKAITAMAAVAGLPGSTEEKIEALIATLLRIKNENPALSLVLPPAFFEVAGRQAIDDTLGRARKIVEGLLAEGAPDADRKDLERNAFTIVHAVDGVINGVLGDPEVDLSAAWIQEGLVALVLGYLRTKKH